MKDDTNNVVSPVGLMTVHNPLSWGRISAFFTAGMGKEQENLVCPLTLMLEITDIVDYFLVLFLFSLFQFSLMSSLWMQEIVKGKIRNYRSLFSDNIEKVAVRKHFQFNLSRQWSDSERTWQYERIIVQVASTIGFTKDWAHHKISTVPSHQIKPKTSGFIFRQIIALKFIIVFFFAYFYHHLQIS